MKPKPTQIAMFAAGDDLPLFSASPIRVETGQYRPKETAGQETLTGCKICLGTKKYQGRPCPVCK